MLQDRITYYPSIFSLYRWKAHTSDDETPRHVWSLENYILFVLPVLFVTNNGIRELISGWAEIKVQHYIQNYNFCCSIFRILSISIAFSILIRHWITNLLNILKYWVKLNKLKINSFWKARFLKVGQKIGSNECFALCARKHSWKLREFSLISLTYTRSMIT